MVAENSVFGSAASSVRKRVHPALLVGLAIVLVLSCWLRLPGLEDKPLHSDEGVNGWFTLRLYWWNLYHYKPNDYHGPLLYYVNLLWFWLLGPSDFALRLGTALCGVVVPLLLLPLRRFLGVVGVVVTGLLIACSPTFVYFSRTVIHEIYLVAATMLGVAAAARFVGRPSWRWASVLGLSVACAFASKETTVITLASVGCGFGLSWALGRRQAGDDRVGDPDLFGGRSRRDAVRQMLAVGPASWVMGLLALLVPMVVLFSSFFTWWPGLLSFFEAFEPWLEHGVSGRNQKKKWDYFVWLLVESNGWLWIPAVLGVSLAFFHRHRFGLMLSGWALSSLSVYSLVPYKTPWCVLNIELPMFALCGWLAYQASLVLRDPGVQPARRFAGLLLVLLPVLMSVPQLRQSHEVNVGGYDDPQHSYIFVQTKRGYYVFLQDLFGVGDDPRFAGEGGPAMINVDPKNPTRWYTITRGWHYDALSYRNGRRPKTTQIDRADIVVAVKRGLSETARRVSRSRPEWHRESYELRPGRRLTAWYRQDLWDAYQARGGRESSPWPRPPAEEIYRPPVPARFR